MKFDFNKRQKIIITSVVMTFILLMGLLYTQLVIDVSLRFKFIILLGILVYGLTFWSLMPGMDKTKAVVLLILPTFFTMSVASFYYVLPIRWFTKLPVAIFYGLSFYILLLAQNVFNVAATRTIPLYRVATTTSFIMTVFSALCLYSVTEALNLSYYWNGLIFFLVSFPLILQILWSMKMEERISSSIAVQSMILSLMISEVAMVLSFWPSTANIRSFAIASILASTMYILVGIVTHHLRERLGRQEVWEYVGFGSIVWIIGLFITIFTS